MIKNDISLAHLYVFDPCIKSIKTNSASESGLEHIAGNFFSTFGRISFVELHAQTICSAITKTSSLEFVYYIHVIPNSSFGL